MLPPAGHLTVDNSSSSKSRGQFLHLFGIGLEDEEGGVRKGAGRFLGPHLTLSVFFLWFVAASTYYGLVLMSTEMLNSSRDACGGGRSNKQHSFKEGSEEEEAEMEEEVECSVHICR